MWEMREKWGKRATVLVENEGGKGKSDLKRGHVRHLNECARSHSSRAVHSVCGTLMRIRVHGGSVLKLAAM
jgi:hypothetical protein